MTKSTDYCGFKWVYNNSSCNNKLISNVKNSYFFLLKSTSEKHLSDKKPPGLILDIYEKLEKVVIKKSKHWTKN